MEEYIAAMARGLDIPIDEARDLYQFRPGVYQVEVLNADSNQSIGLTTIANCRADAESWAEDWCESKVSETKRLDVRSILDALEDSEFWFVQRAYFLRPMQILMDIP